MKIATKNIKPQKLCLKQIKLLIGFDCFILCDNKNSKRGKREMITLTIKNMIADNVKQFQ